MDKKTKSTSKKTNKKSTAAVSKKKTTTQQPGITQILYRKECPKYTNKKHSTTAYNQTMISD